MSDLTRYPLARYGTFNTTRVAAVVPVEDTRPVAAVTAAARTAAEYREVDGRLWVSTSIATELDQWIAEHFSVPEPTITEAHPGDTLDPDRPCLLIGGRLYLPAEGAVILEAVIYRQGQGEDQVYRVRVDRVECPPAEYPALQAEGVLEASLLAAFPLSRYVQARAWLEGFTAALGGKRVEVEVPEVTIYDQGAADLHFGTTAPGAVVVDPDEAARLVEAWYRTVDTLGVAALFPGVAKAQEALTRLGLLPD